MIAGKDKRYKRAASNTYSFSNLNVSHCTSEKIDSLANAASLVDQYALPRIGIIVAAIAIVGAVIVLMLRKR